MRYSAVGLGDIAQEALLLGIEQTGNSVVTALVTGDPAKAQALGARYSVKDTYGYNDFNAMLASGCIDAIYLATPNWRHAEFATPALRAGIRVLCEKPLERDEIRFARSRRWRGIWRIRLPGWFRGCGRWRR